MKILVTGGAGYIGAHVVRSLAESGYCPVILDDLRKSRRERTHDFPWENVALEDTEALFRVFREHRPEGVVHLAGYISVAESVTYPLRYWQNNLSAAANLVLAAVRYPVRTFVFSSTAAVYGNADRVPITEDSVLKPTSPYGESKLSFERLLHGASRVLGYRSVALRYFNAAGAHPAWGVGEAHEPEEHLIPRVIRALRGDRKVRVYGRDYPTADGTCLRDYIHVTDLARAHVQVIEAEHLDFPVSLNVGTGRGCSVLEVIRAASEYFGEEPLIEYLPRRAGDPAALIADSGRLQALTGWCPEHSGLDEIVATAAEWDLRLNP